MLIQPALPNVTNVAAYAGSVTPTGVEQEQARADIPPVEETEKNAPGQNQLFSASREPQSTEARPTEGQATDQQATQAEGDDEGARQQSAQQTQQALTEEDQALIAQLKARDREVRVHEAAHAAVGGRYAGSASFEYTRGPDGRNYATGGEVSISVSEVPGDPQATLEKARVIRAAALAPADPSAQDRRVAAEAAQLEINARNDLRTEQSEEAGPGEAQQDEDSNRPDAAVEEAEAVEEQAEVAPPVIQSRASEETESNAEEDGENRQERPDNAREELEKILLGSQGLLQQANQAGLVDPQNPYGQSGFLDVIA